MIRIHSLLVLEYFFSYWLKLFIGCHVRNVFYIRHSIIANQNFQIKSRKNIRTKSNPSIFSTFSVCFYFLCIWRWVLGFLVQLRTMFLVQQYWEQTNSIVSWSIVYHKRYRVHQCHWINVNLYLTKKYTHIYTLCIYTQHSVI